jgi:hypothetical protein
MVGWRCFLFCEPAFDLRRPGMVPVQQSLQDIEQSRGDPANSRGNGYFWNRGRIPICGEWGMVGPQLQGIRLRRP